MSDLVPVEYLEYKKGRWFVDLTDEKKPVYIIRDEPFQLCPHLADDRWRVVGAKKPRGVGQYFDCDEIELCEAPEPKLTNKQIIAQLRAEAEVLNEVKAKLKEGNEQLKLKSPMPLEQGLDMALAILRDLHSLVNKESDDV